MPEAHVRILVALLVLASSASHAAPMFVPLGNLDGPDSRSEARAVSADGSVVVGMSRGWAFRWTRDEGMVGLSDFDGYSEANDVSSDGSVIVGSSHNRVAGAINPEAFRWTRESGLVGLGDLPGGYSNSGASGVSADGSIVIGHGFDAAGLQSVRWTSEGGMVAIGGFGSPYTRGVSGDGSVVVGNGHASYPNAEAFRWTSESGMVGLGDLPGGYSSSLANDVSADGSVLVGRGESESGSEALRWTSADGMIGLGDLPGGRFLSEAYGVSADGSIIVGSSTVVTRTIIIDGTPFSADDPKAFLWDEANGMRPLDQVLTSFGLDLTGWWITAALGISDDGHTIVGYGTNPSGQREAWLAYSDDWSTPVPEPGTAALLAIGLAAIAARATR
jgi:probable HAF family extracellular repeat protein